ncbi:Lrp/AsnC family transcriptional regulator [Porticoccaceae bacterium]|jgi:DNA-binding Lrp family transcriptional regulator|nr:Lrp/AsnC family transcriptional regulator [Porticoccaceae bacterium]MDB2343276.1 Lrp/AsnC family transcriptional regulator [Porticoccaceae bacterium]MDB2634098.1 Lrp/AsnC family transcriptional regulator [Porticoccaceae bacterium]MDB2663934.1 Lrp/AsnC family transcriptional regulator [Porticoccaceae bacterium]
MLNNDRGVRYDSVDRDLISLLRTDARASISTLAKALKVSRGTVQNRLDRLIASDAILGFTIRASASVDDSAIRAVMMIEITGKSTADIIKKLRGLPELQKVHTTNGAWDLVAEIQASSLADFDNVLREVRLIDGIANSETSILLSTI